MTILGWIKKHPILALLIPFAALWLLIIASPQFALSFFSFMTYGPVLPFLYGFMQVGIVLAAIVLVVGSVIVAKAYLELRREKRHPKDDERKQ